MGGRLSVESEPGKGSTFHFTALFNAAKTSRWTTARPEPSILQGRSVLVLDNHATNREILGETLKNWGMLAEVVENTALALAALERARNTGKPFSFTLLDGDLRQIDRFALAQRIKQDRALCGATVVMLNSNHPRRRDTEHWRELGIAALLVKPVLESELLEAMLVALGALTPCEATTRDTALAGSPQGEKLRILLVEDNFINQRLAVRLLETLGHISVVANNGREALEKIDQQEHEGFDLVLMDVQMPEMDGFEATAAIRERERGSIDGAHMPVIAMTAHAMKGDREDCLRAGMDDYISKPITPEALMSAMKRILVPKL